MSLIIQPNPQSRLRHREHLQFMLKTLNVFFTDDLSNLNIDMLVIDLHTLVREEEAAMSVDSGSALTTQRDAADLLRNKTHSALYHQTKVHLYIEDNPENSKAAQNIMRIIRQVGNPWKAADHAKTSLITELLNELKPYAADVELIGAQPLVDKLAKANKDFIAIDNRYQKEKAERPSGNVTAVRRKINPVYRALIGAINTDAVRYKDGRFDTLAAGINTISGSSTPCWHSARATPQATPNSNPKNRRHKPAPINRAITRRQRNNRNPIEYI